MKLFKRRKPVAAERRRFVRISNQVRINYEIANEGPRSNCRSKDISESGIRFSLYQRLEVKTPLKLFIYLEEAAAPICVIGEVAWIRETSGEEYPYEVGIEFSFADSAFRTKIKNLIQSISK